jgi:hypothetical protein
MGRWGNKNVCSFCTLLPTPLRVRQSLMGETPKTALVSPTPYSLLPNTIISLNGELILSIGAIVSAGAGRLK